jgi:hypothetical protein
MLVMFYLSLAEGIDSLGAAPLPPDF